MQYYNIQVASKLSGVASPTIRAWEKRYNAVAPERGDNKHRLYSERDIEKLSLLNKLTDLGQSIGKVAHLSNDELKKLYSECLQVPFDSQPKKIQHDLDIQKTLNNFYLALSAYKLDIISHELDKVKKILSPKEFCLEIIVPLFSLVGDKVQRGELSIAQEHTLSAIVSFHIGQIIGQQYKNSFRTDELILITTPEGEMHEIGILASALLCVHYGLKFIYLGANLPAASLAEACDALKVKAVILGVTKGHELTEKMSLAEFMAEFESKLESKVEIWLGGNLRPYVKAEIENKKIKYFTSLESLSSFLEERG
jgi:MerR family transcriptional regulator, light-induced transcriptional regulator